MDYLIHTLVPIALFGATVIIVIAILNFILKMRLISSGNKDEYYIKLLTGSFEYKSSALKWGLILLFGGIGLVVIEFIPGGKVYGSPLPFGIEAIFLSIGLLVYYLIVRKELQ